MGSYSHPGIAEREDIMIRWRDHEGVSRMARGVGRDKSTVSGEVARNGRQASTGRRCRASTAQSKADARRARCRRPRLMDDPEGRSLVAALIRDRRWSPEQASARIALKRPALSVSDATVYRAVADGTLDREMPGHRKMGARLRRIGRRRRRRGGDPEARGKIKATHELSERPKAADARRPAHGGLGGRHRGGPPGRGLPRDAGRQEERLPRGRQGGPKGARGGRRGDRAGVRA